MRKVEVFASRYVGLVYYRISLLITTVVLGISSYISQYNTCPRLREIHSVNRGMYLRGAIPVVSAVLGARSASRIGQRKALTACKDLAF